LFLIIFDYFLTRSKSFLVLENFQKNKLVKIILKLNLKKIILNYVIYVYLIQKIGFWDFDLKNLKIENYSIVIRGQTKFFENYFLF
jgi:hypothetical protein